MARVAVLTHVKESAIPEALNVARVGPRMPWSGGKLVSNKEEALRKFLARKPQSSVTLTAEQIKILETPSTTTSHQANKNKSHKHKNHLSKHDVIHKINPTTKRMAHRAHVKVQASNKKTTLVVNGRVVGPRVGGAIKANAARHPKAATKKKPNETASMRSSKPLDTAGMALQDKLGLSLDALVKRNGK